MSACNCSLGITPASLLGVARTMTMDFMRISFDDFTSIRKPGFRQALAEAKNARALVAVATDAAR